MKLPYVRTSVLSPEANPGAARAMLCEVREVIADVIWCGILEGRRNPQAGC